MRHKSRAARNPDFFLFTVCSVWKKSGAIPFRKTSKFPLNWFTFRPKSSSWILNNQYYLNQNGSTIGSHSCSKTIFRDSYVKSYVNSYTESCPLMRISLLRISLLRFFKTTGGPRLVRILGFWKNRAMWNSY